MAAPFIPNTHQDYADSLHYILTEVMQQGAAWGEQRYNVGVTMRNAMCLFTNSETLSSLGKC